MASPNAARLGGNSQRSAVRQREGLDVLDRAKI